MFSKAPSSSVGGVDSVTKASALRVNQIVVSVNTASDVVERTRVCARRVRPLKTLAGVRGEEKSIVQVVKDLAVGCAESVLCVLQGPTQPGAKVKRRDCALIATRSRRASTATSAKNVVIRTRLRIRGCVFDPGVF